MKNRSPIIRLKMKVAKLSAAFLSIVFIVCLPLGAKAQEDDILSFMPAFLAAAKEARSCEDGVFANCTSQVGCRVINGLFENGQCTAKPEARQFAEQLTGNWGAVTSLQNGNYFNYFSFNLSSLQSIRARNDYALNGDSFTSSSFSNKNATFVVSSYDSTNDDWFILDYWGTDIGTISIIEMSQTSSNQFDGCEFFVNFPDLTYQDGVCNPIRLRRSGSRPTFLRGISNIVDDLASYVGEVFNSAQSGSLPINIVSNRPSIDRLVGLPVSPIAPLEPIAITSPTSGSSTNQGLVEVFGNLDANINLDRVEVNGERVFPDSNIFSSNVTLSDGANVIRAVADYGRRTYTAEVSLSTDNVQPTVVAAASTSSTTVVLQFSEPMSDDSVAAATNFNIVRSENNGTLPVTAVQFFDESHTSVLLATGLQSDTNYTITAVNVKDRAGNTISSPIAEVDFDLSKAEFIGTAPTGNEVIDTDGDGLLDHIELDGWPVVIVRTDGTSETVNVTSDPFNGDTDGDGISDAEERHGGMNPRNNDSDGDTLLDYDEWNIIYSNPVDQDSDDDGIQDGFEYLFFKTSPILADTDGDQIDDPTELAAGNRNPLVADLPSPDITIGNVNLQLDTRFTYTNEAGEVDTQSKTVEATLTQSENDSLSTANESSTKNTLSSSDSLTRQVSVEVESGLPPSGKVSASLTTNSSSEQGSENGSTNSFGEESSRGSEEAYHDSLSVDVARDTRETISREVLGASMKVDLKVANSGDIPFTVSNLELSAQVQDPRDRRRFIPVASLTPENSDLGSINIGVLGDTDRGPFVFNSESVFPQEIQELMKSPSGMVIQLANYDIVDEQGNNFAFKSQDVLDRTAGITFDLGDGRVESYRVATASEHDENTGEPVGITMARALEIIGLSRYATIKDGGNGISESFAGGDDVQVILPTQAGEPKTVVISAGPDGVIDPATTVNVNGVGDDVLVPADYETEPYATAASIIDGGNGILETLPDPSGDDELVDETLSLIAPNNQVTPGQLLIRAYADKVITTVPSGDDVLVPAGIERNVLIRFRDAAASSEGLKYWALYSQTNIEGIDLDDFRLRAGQQYDFALLQDKDFDGVYAREEYLHGTSDDSRNTDGCDENIPLADQPKCDSISDFDEIRTGWRVQLKSSPQSYQVYPNPIEADSDRDGLLDDVERACGLDPRQRDTDFDGLNDREEIYGIIVNGPDDAGIAMESVSFSDPSHVPFFITRYLGGMPLPQTPPYNPTVAPSFAEHELTDACIAAIGIEGFATDPLNADTDGDLISDFDELSLGLHPNDRNDGGSFLDDDGDGIPNNQELAGKTIVFNDGETAFCQTSPNRTDTDGDKLPDLLEEFLGSNPCEPDTDGDGILDTDEYKNGGAVCVGDPAAAVVHPDEPTLCSTFLNKAVEDYNAFVSACNEAEFCDVATIEGNGTFGLLNEQQLGTNLNHADTDNDGHYDLDEITPGQRRLVANDVLSAITDTGYADVTSVFDPDSDNDGLLDGTEIYTYGSNPASAFTDTDDTDLNDGQEVDVGRDPAFNDKRVTISPFSFAGTIANNTNIVTSSVLVTFSGSTLPDCTTSGGGTSFRVGFTACSTTVILREGGASNTTSIVAFLTAFDAGNPTIGRLPSTLTANCDSILSVGYNNATDGVLLGAGCSFGSSPDNAGRSITVSFSIDLNLD